MMKITRGKLGLNTSPKILQGELFFYIGIHFCIPVGIEKRSLGPSQFLRTKNLDCYTYVEYGWDSNQTALQGGGWMYTHNTYQQPFNLTSSDIQYMYVFEIQSNMSDIWLITLRLIYCTNPLSHPTVLGFLQALFHFFDFTQSPHCNKEHLCFYDVSLNLPYCLIISFFLPTTVGVTGISGCASNKVNVVSVM